MIRPTEKPMDQNLMRETLPQADPALAGMLADEETRMRATLNLIAAENHAPAAVMEVMGSIFNTKTIEGYPGRRFHAGCRHVDAVENLAITRAQALFGAEYANVQPHSGVSANLAVYFALLNIGDRILSMELAHGGHLSHGYRASITGKCFQAAHYGVDPETERIDYDAVRRIALEFRPRLIIAGASAYSRLIDYERMGAIAREVDALMMADMAHIAGLVAARIIPSPVPHCDIVTFTAYKTMMGGRGGVILARKEHGPAIDRSIFPGCQGTSAVNMIAAKALVFKMATRPDYIAVQRATVDNAVALAQALAGRGFRLVTGGTENHQVIVDVSSRGMTGGKAEEALEAAGIVANRNVIPRDAGHPGRVSGLRLGTAGMASRAMRPADMLQVARMIGEILDAPDDAAVRDRAAKEVAAICERFPL